MSSSAAVTSSTTRLLVARIVLVVAALAATVSGIGSVGAILTASVDAQMVETWRAVGLVFFGGVFAVLAFRPHACRGLWEITLVNKLVLAALATVYAVHGAAVDAWQSAAADGTLVVMVAVAYVLSEAWRGSPR